MRVTIIKHDNFIAINGRGTNVVDLSTMPDGVRVVQWHDGKGEVELTEVGSITGREYPVNQAITDISAYQPLIDAAIEAFDLEDNPPPPQEPTLEDLKARALADLDAKTAMEIISGFECDALGEMHHYPSAITDQLNLTAMFFRAGVDPAALYPFTCRDSVGVWARKPHTADQIQAVGRAGMDANVAARLRKDAQVARIMAAESPDDLI